VQTEKRHRRIEALAKLIDQHAREAGIPMVALKGAALHEMGIYRAGERPMADLDLLVEEPDMAGATKLLEAQGFDVEISFWRNRVFKAPGATVVGGLGEHCDYPIKVELHWRIHERLPLELTDISPVVFPTNPKPGINPYPSRLSLLMHLVLHAAGGMMNRDLRLVHLHDLALVCGGMQAEDWEEILRQGKSQQAPWWFLPPLQLARRYYPDIVPDEVLLRLRSACPARLRRAATRRSITDFSLSNLWVHALPGIEWARSGSEAFRYARGRVRPDAESQRARKIDAANIWATHSSWLGLPQRYRILRWMTSRPTRPQTMYVVRETLAQPLQLDSPHTLVAQ
jgi:hypothetical protein